MKTLKHHLRLTIALVVFMLPWASSQAIENFQKAGIIGSMSNDQFTLHNEDQKYRFAPGAKIISKIANRQKFSDFKSGDYIYFEGVLLNDINYVNIIHYQKLAPM